MLKSLIVPKHSIVLEKFQKDIEVPLCIVFGFEFNDLGCLDLCFQLHLVIELIIFVEICLQVKLEIRNDLLIMHTLPIRHLVEVFIAFHEEFWEVIYRELLL